MQADTDAVLSISKIEIFFRKDNRGGGLRRRGRESTELRSRQVSDGDVEQTRSRKHRSLSQREKKMRKIDLNFRRTSGLTLPRFLPPFWLLTRM
jgi:hypothetical protein